jgi:hypothetical protein
MPLNPKDPLNQELIVVACLRLTHNTKFLNALRDARMGLVMRGIEQTPTVDALIEVMERAVSQAHALYFEIVPRVGSLNDSPDRN